MNTRRDFLKGTACMGAALRLPRIPGVELVAVAEVRGARLDLAKKAGVPNVIDDFMAEGG